MCEIHFEASDWPLLPRSSSAPRHWSEARLDILRLRDSAVCFLCVARLPLSEIALLSGVLALVLYSRVDNHSGYNHACNAASSRISVIRLWSGVALIVIALTCSREGSACWCFKTCDKDCLWTNLCTLRCQRLLRVQPQIASSSTTANRHLAHR